MNIKEAEKLTGVSSRNIRFYEQKGLVNPARNTENDYREYSEGEIQRLKLIRALRMVDMPLDQIKGILDGELPLPSAAAEQRQKIKERIKKLETAAYFCEELAKPDQNIDEVLMRMDEPENRKRLSSKWKRDYSEVAKKLMQSFLTGALWMFGSWIAFLVLTILGNWMRVLFGNWDVPLRVAALVPIALWFYGGYKLYEKKWWWIKCVLAHMIPGTVMLLCYYAFEENFYLFALLMFSPYLIICEGVSWDWKTLVMLFWITFGVFCLGMLWGKITAFRRDAVNVKHIEEPTE